MIKPSGPAVRKDCSDNWAPNVNIFVFGWRNGSPLSQCTNEMSWRFLLDVQNVAKNAKCTKDNHWHTNKCNTDNEIPSRESDQQTGRPIGDFGPYPISTGMASQWQNQKPLLFSHERTWGTTAPSAPLIGRRVYLHRNTMLVWGMQMAYNAISIYPWSPSNCFPTPGNDRMTTQKLSGWEVVQPLTNSTGPRAREHLERGFGVEICYIVTKFPVHLRLQ